jgi:hypothetical protein
MSKSAEAFSARQVRNPSLQDPDDLVLQMQQPWQSVQCRSGLIAFLQRALDQY